MNPHSHQHLKDDEGPETDLGRAATDPPGHAAAPHRSETAVHLVRRLWMPATVIAVGFVAAYYNVLIKLAHDWATDGNYSHGFLIVPLAAYLAWERRDRLQRMPVRPSAFGLALVVASLGVLAVGTLGAELFLTRVSLIGVLGGVVLFLYGWGHLRTLAFPLLFLLLMIPLPAIVFNQIAFPLQLLASQAGERVLVMLGVPVLREGNVIVLAHTTLEVAEACSGIRSLVSLLTLGIIYGYFTDSRVAVRLIVALSTIPVAVIANGLRVAGTGVAAQFYGPEAAEGFFHEFSGWAVFVVAFVALLGIQKMTVLGFEAAGDPQVDHI